MLIGLGSLERGSCGVGPSGFQTKGLEYRDVVPSLQPALGDVLRGFFPLAVKGCFLGVYTGLWDIPIWMSYNIPARYF